MRADCFCGVLLLLACSGSAEPRSQAPPEQGGARPPTIDGAQRTAAQEKISSRLLDAIERRRGGPGAVESTLRSSVVVDADGATLVDIDAEVTEGLVGEIEARDGTVVSSFPQFRSIRARIPLGELESIAELSDVRFIEVAEEPITQPTEPAIRSRRGPVRPR